MQNEAYKSGFVAVIGRPNVGKSTLINTYVGKKVAITSSKPQTTRNRILGILTTDQYQIAFTDTPGIHKPQTELERRMVNASYDATHGVDCILFMTTPVKQVLKGDEIILSHLKNTKLPVFLVINKLDQLKRFNDIDLTIAIYQKLFPFTGVYPISILDNKNLNYLLEDIVKTLPLGPKYYPEDMSSDHSVRFLMAEVIREKILILTEEEVPHSIAVTIDHIKPCEENENYQDVYATIYVERDSQKKIIIGKNGAMMKAIKQKSMGDLKRLLGSKLHLELWVKVKKDWKNRENDLQALGYSEDQF